jgi:hypothetical protein
VRPAGDTFSGIYNQTGIVVSWSGHVHYHKLDPSGTTYLPSSGDISWKVTGTDPGGCVYKGAGIVLRPGRRPEGVPKGGYFTTERFGDYFVELNTGATGTIEGYDSFPVSVSCPGRAPYTRGYPLSDWLHVSYAGVAALKVTGNVMKGSDSYSTGPDYAVKWQWSLAFE